MIRVLVVDDHPVVRDGLRGVLDAEPDMEVVGEAAHGAEALARIPDAAPDVVLMDLRMPVMGGVEAARRIHRAKPAIQVVILTAYDDPALKAEAVDAGIYAFLVKGCSARLISEVANTACEMRRSFDSDRF